MNRIKLGISLAVLACAGAAFAAAEPMARHMMDGHEMMGHEMTRAEGQAHAEKLFKMLDLNQDGKLDAADRAAHMGKMFDRLDANHDGSISRDEFAAAAHPEGGPPMGPGGMGGPGGEHRMGARGMGGQMDGHRGMHMRVMGIAMAIMHEADPQRSGSVSHDAFMAGAIRLFDKADTNHDGKISADERKAAHKLIAGEMRGPMGDGPPPPPMDH